MPQYDYLVVGAGLFGSIFAYEANKIGKKVLVIDKRNHIGGNCYDYYDEKTNILMNKYGAHLFHTNDEEVFNYINQYGNWCPWEHKVLGLIDNQHLPIPPNITTVNKMFNLNIKTNEEMKNWLEETQIKYDTITNGEEMAKTRVGEVLYEKIFKHYTYKQWNKYPEELAPEVLARIPIRDSFDDRYFSDKYQVLPEKGYTFFFQSILDKHKHNIDVKLNCDFFDIKHQITKDHLVIYTGPIDAYFADKGLPKLEYRSIDFHIERQMNTDFYQPYSVVNYPSAETPYTRCVEYKHFLNQKSEHTVYVKETTTDIGEPYYPVLNDRNKELYEKYQKMIEEEGKNIHFIGRLASYKYFNMDQAIKNSLDYYKKHFEKECAILFKKNNQGKKIFSVFSGRERYMNILSIYIDKLLKMKLIDEVHIWDFTQTPNDRLYIQDLCKKQKHFLKKPVVDNWRGYYKYYSENLNDNDILIKCDDDIVYIDVNTFNDYLSSIKNGSFYYPNIVNNDVCAYYQQKYNVHNLFDYDVDFEKSSKSFNWFPLTDWYINFEKANQIHKMFLADPEKFILKDKEIYKYSSRISINMFGCTGITAKEHFIKVVNASHLDDEGIISSTNRVGNYINLNCSIVHFQFNRQSGEKLDKLYLQEYYKLAVYNHFTNFQKKIEINPNNELNKNIDLTKKDIDPIIKIFCDKRKRVWFKNVKKSTHLIENPNTYIIYTKDGEQKIFPRVDYVGNDLLEKPCNDLEQAKNIIDFRNDTEFYFYIRGHIRNSFQTDRLKNFVKLLKIYFPNIKFILQTWEKQECKNNESWKEITECNTIISKLTIENYFEDKDVTEQCLIIDEESIELVGSTNGTIGVGPCPKQGWKNMWYGIYKGLEHLDINSSNNVIVSFRYDYFDIHYRMGIDEEKIIQFINNNLDNKNIQFIRYQTTGTDNLYLGRYNKIKALIEKFHFKLDDVLDTHGGIYNQELLVNIIAETI